MPKKKVPREKEVLVKQNKLSGADVIDIAFGFLSNPNMMFESEAQRKARIVGNTQIGEMEIDTCYVTDTKYYETGIRDKRYKTNGKWFIVDEYNNQEEAQKGHDKWVDAFKSKTPPSKIQDIHSSEWFIFASPSRNFNSVNPAGR